MKRGVYWTAVFIHALIVMVPLYPAVRRLIDLDYVLPSFYIPWVLPVWCFYNILMIIPLWSAAVRRYHTLPRSGWWLLVGVIPLAGWYLVLSWLLQKGEYEEYMWRLKKAGPATFEEKRREAERPRNGGWFFVVFLILAASGWFINRQIMRSGSVETALREIQDRSISVLSPLLTNRDKEPEGSGNAGTRESVIIYVRDASFDPTPSPTIIPQPTETPVPTRIIPGNIEIK